MNIILIDTSFFTFHRFFATYKWFSLAHSEHKYDKNYNWLDNDIFKEKYEKMYLETIIKLVSLKIYNKSKIIFCLDANKETLWRSTKCNYDYKGLRQDLSLKANFKPTFTYTFEHIIPNIIKNNKNINKLKIDKLEADDIIAIITKHYEKETIYIMSGDEDFLQLGRPNLFFINFKIKKPFELTIEEAKYNLHKKLLLGDKSDCIPTIFNKSIKNKKELINSIELFNEFINDDKNKEIKKKYKENQIMIDFNFIPKKYIKIVIDKIKKFIDMS
jgi:5'-3' exonuclease